MNALENKSGVYHESLSDEQSERQSQSACDEQRYTDSLTHCFDLFFAPESTLITQARAQGIDTDGMSRDEIAHALYKHV